MAHEIAGQIGAHEVDRIAAHYRKFERATHRTESGSPSESPVGGRLRGDSLNAREVQLVDDILDALDIVRMNGLR